MNPVIVQQIESYIQACLSRSYSDQTFNIFDGFIEKCQLYYDRPAHSIREIKENMNTKLKGDIFEHFCLKYLTAVYGLEEAWMLKDVPAEILRQLSLRRNDVGIDLIGRDHRGRYYAVQAKYRKRNQYKQKTVLGWKTLSTFYALVTKTGPWVKHIVMTNADYIRHIGKKTLQDKSICYGSLQGIKTEQWQKMAKLVGHRLGEEVIEEEVDEEEIEEKKPKIVLKNKITFKNRPEADELRRRRLAFFSNI